MAVSYTHLKTFTEEYHLPLPAPRVTIVDFYKEKGTENVVDFADQAFYGQESKLDITDVNTKCSYQDVYKRQPETSCQKLFMKRENSRTAGFRSCAV